MAMISAELGEKELALDWLEKAYAKREEMDSLMHDHHLDSLRNQPRQRSAQVGLVLRAKLFVNAGEMERIPRTVRDRGPHPVAAHLER